MLRVCDGSTLAQNLPPAQAFRCPADVVNHPEEQTRILKPFVVAMYMEVVTWGLQLGVVEDMPGSMNTHKLPSRVPP